MAGIKLNHVPYRGSGPALTDLLGGHVGDDVRDACRRRSGWCAKAKCARSPSPGRSARQFPGSADRRGGRACPATRPCCITGWWRRPARRGPSSTSSTRRCATRSPTTRCAQRFATEGAEPLPSTPEEYATDIDHEEIKWSKIVRESGAKGSERGAPRRPASGKMRRSDMSLSRDTALHSTSRRPSYSPARTS